MRKKFAFILVFTVLSLSISGFVFFKKQETSRTLLCEISEFLQREEKLLEHSYRTQRADEFFWTFFGHEPFEKSQTQLTQLKSSYVDVQCAEAGESSGWDGLLNSEEQIRFLQAQRFRADTRKNLAKEMRDLLKGKEQIYAHIQADLKKYRFHVRQLKRGTLPAQIVAEACRAPASVVDPKRQQSCRRALILTKEFRVKDESNLGNNRRIILEKWQAFKAWIETTISNIEQDGGEEESETSQ